MRVLFLLLTLLVSHSTQLKADPVKICAIDWPPYTFAGNDHKANQIVKGISYEIVSEVFNRLDKSFTMEVLPWARCLKLVKDGSYDGIMDDSDPADQLRPATGFYPLAIYVPQDASEAVFNWQNMNKKVVGMVNGYAYTQAITDFDGWEKRLVVRDEQLIHMLKTGRLNYILMDIFSAPILAKQHRVSVKPLLPLVDSTKLHLVFSENRQLLSKAFDEQVKELISEGVLDRVYLKYLDKSYREIHLMSSQINRGKNVP